MATSLGSVGLQCSIPRTPLTSNFGQGHSTYPFPHLCIKRRRPILWKGRGHGHGHAHVHPLHVIQAIKLVETYDGSFHLEPESEKALRVLLSSELFCNQVAEQSESGAEGSSFEFTGELFKPLPWSVTTKHGMPQEFEKYLDRDKYAIINVPPNFIFKAKFKQPNGQWLTPVEFKETVFIALSHPRLEVTNLQALTKEFLNDYAIGPAKKVECTKVLNEKVNLAIQGIQEELTVTERKLGKQILFDFLMRLLYMTPVLQ